MGQAVLPRRPGRMDREARRRPRRRHEGRSRVPGDRVRRPGAAPDPSRRRRRLVGLVLLPVSGADLGGIAALGAFHGVNPAMGWLFAVALALQERSRRVLAAAFVPIAIGHAAAIGLAVLLVEELQEVL